MRTAGQESLLVYGFHLFVIFGVLRGKHLGPILGLEAGWAVSLALSAAIILLMLWLAGRWQWLKRTHPDPVKRAQAGIVLIALMLFLA